MLGFPIKRGIIRWLLSKKFRYENGPKMNLFGIDESWVARIHENYLALFLHFLTQGQAI
jgi:hypothetical protein